MRKIALHLLAAASLAPMAFAGSDMYSGKEMKQVAPAPPPCPEWYADNELNVSLWGTYAFGGDNGRDFRTRDFDFVDGERADIDETLGEDGWGGGGDIKYFFHRYFGIGVEGFGLSTDHHHHVSEALRSVGLRPDGDNGLGAVLGTLTLRYPIPCSRFAPYIYGGGGVVWGGDHERWDFVGVEERFHHRSDDDARAIGQVGGGFEVRFTKHIGWINDVSWNFTDGDDFGMVRGGLNFAF